MATTIDRPAKQRPFPRFCANCGKQEVVLAVVPYSREFKYDDELYTIDIPNLESPRCRACGQLVFGVNVDKQIHAAERLELKLLSSTQIREGRERLGLSRGELAGRLGISEATLADWEDDITIQPRTADNLLRVFFAFPEVRAALNGAERDAGLGVLAG
jgi:DNA-binding transcriptional regulator YiaG